MTAHASDDSLDIAILGSRGYPSTYGGFETFIRKIAPELVHRGHTVTVYCRERAQRSSRPKTIDGIRCVWTPGIDTKAGSTLSFGLTSHIDASFRGFDVALVLNVANGFFIPLLSLRGIPTVLNTDGLEWTRGKWGQCARRIFYTGAKMSARYATALISDSEAIGAVWASEFGVQSRFIPYGADVPAHPGDERVRALGIESGAYALVVARLIPENNVELTLDALALLPEVKVVVVGSANYSSPLTARLRQLSSAGRVRWLGHIHDQDLLVELWANAGVYVHGHSVGGTNPALLQALGAGAPTLALDTVFNREVIQSEDQLYDHDPTKLAMHIQDVLSDSDIRDTWRRSGRDTIRARYSWPSVFTAYESILKAAAGRGSDREPA